MNTKDQQLFSPQATVAIDGTKIKYIRESKGLTQEYLATVVGVAIRTVSCWENNRSPNIKRENAESVAKALEVPLDDILKRESLFSAENEQNSEEAAPLSPAPAAGKVGKKISSRKIAGAFTLLILILFSGILYSIHRLQSSSSEISVDSNRAEISGKIQAERYLPDHTPVGQAFPVVITVSSSLTETSSFLLKESLPPACTVLRGTPTADLQANNAADAKWVSKLAQGENTRFAYLASCDVAKASAATKKGDGQGDTYTFSGRIMVDKIAQEPVITGANEIKLTDYHWADNNQDHRIDDNEILAIYNSFDLLKELGVDLEEIRQAWVNSKGTHWNSEQKKFTVLGKPCGQSWQTPLSEINGIIENVHNSEPSENGLSELLLDLSTLAGPVTVHVFPKKCIDNTPGKFTLIQGQEMFTPGDTITVLGSAFQVQEEENICAAEIISENYTFTRATKNELRDLVTGALNGEICRSAGSETEQQSIYAHYHEPRGKHISWHLTVSDEAPAVLIMIQNIPPGTTLLNTSPPHHSYDQETGTVKWLLTDLKPGALLMQMELDTPIKKKGEISGELLFEDNTEDSILWLF